MKKVWAMLLAAVLVCLIPVEALANSAEPPSRTILVRNGPEDLELTVRFTDGETVHESPLDGFSHLWDHYYQWYDSLTAWTLEHWYHMGPVVATTLIVQGEGVYLELSLDEVKPAGYSNLITLDVAAGTLTSGEPLWRIVVKIALRMLSTLLIEGIVFWLYGYQGRRSWVIFLLVNLLTQAWLNGCLFGTLLDSYRALVLLLLIIEPVVFVVEMLVMCLFIKEKKRSYTAICTVVSNLASLLLGGVVIGLFPV